MSNSFSKEERVAFEDLLEGFQDALVLSRHVNIYNTDQTMMERANNTIWRPQPYIAQSISSTPGNSIAGQYQALLIDHHQRQRHATANGAVAVPHIARANVQALTACRLPGHHVRALQCQPQRVAIGQRKAAPGLAVLVFAAAQRAAVSH